MAAEAGMVCGLAGRGTGCKEQKNERSFDKLRMTAFL